MKLSTFARFLLLLFALGVGLLLANACQAQTPFPFLKPLCPEAIEWQGRYQALRRHEDSVMAVYDRRIGSLKAGQGTLVAEANAKLAAERTRNETLLTQNETLSANLDEQTSLRESAQRELYQWKPRTKAGLLLRKVRNGLAIVGGVSLATGTLLFFYR